MRTLHVSRDVYITFMYLENFTSFSKVGKYMRILLVDTYFPTLDCRRQVIVQQCNSTLTLDKMRRRRGVVMSRAAANGGESV